MIDVIVCAGFNLFRMYVIYRFIRIFLKETKHSRTKELLTYMLFWIMNTSLFLAFQLAWINVLCNLIGIGLLVSLYTCRWKEIFFITVSIYAVSMACDVFVMCIFVQYTDGNIYNQVYGAIGVLLVFFCELLIEKIVSNRKNIHNKYPWFLICIPLCSILLIIILIYTKSATYHGISGISLGLLFLNFLMFCFYNLLLKLLQEKYEMELMQYQSDIYRNQVQLMEEGMERVTALRHDLKHHMNELNLMAEKYHAKKMQNYIQDMQNFFQNPHEVIASGNFEIDSVLNYMFMKAEEMQLNVETDIQIPEQMQHTFDMNVILGNLLENAMEAAVQTEEKYINVKIQLRKGVLKMTIENSFVKERLKKSTENGFFTTKRDAAQHGIGLKNVKRIVEKYQGEMAATTKENRFQVKIILYMGKEA